MPAIRPSYTVCLGDRLEVEVVQLDGGRALIVERLDAVPEVVGGRALKIPIFDMSITSIGGARRGGAPRVPPRLRSSIENHGQLA
jgi:hypothetical protein